MARGVAAHAALAVALLAAGRVRGAQAQDEGLRDANGKGVMMPPLPKIDSEYWIHSMPIEPESLKGKVVLVDFWDYTCVNCLRTLPYIEAWHQRYKDRGLVLLGVHAPEFEFAKKIDNVKRAVEGFGLTYPIVMDNDFAIWRAFGNRYWPAKYLFDKNGRLRYTHFGEGGYGEGERAIQTLLREIDPKALLPAVMEPVREADKDGAVCVRPTPEIYLGVERGRIGNAPHGGGGRGPSVEPGKPFDFVLPAKLEEDVAYAEGTWQPLPASLRFAGKGGDRGAIVIDFTGAEANLVIHPTAPGNTRVDVELGGKPIPPEMRGADVLSGPDGQTWIEVVEPRMYRLVKTNRRDRFVLRLSAAAPGFEAFAFTFVPLCEGDVK